MSAQPCQVIHHPGEDRLHLWWELTYAQYLTIPRSVMQTMPDEWQDKMAALLEELDSTMEWRPKDGCYWVKLKGSDGRFRSDPLCDYERGRRRVQHLKIPQEVTK